MEAININRAIILKRGGFILKNSTQLIITNYWPDTLPKNK